jgi:hypothetical protein
MHSLHYPANIIQYCSHFTILQPLHNTAVTSLSYSHYTIVHLLHYPANFAQYCSHFTILQPLHQTAVTSLSCSHYTILQSLHYPAAITPHRCRFTLQKYFTRDKQNITREKRTFPTVISLSCTHYTILQSVVVSPNPTSAHRTTSSPRVYCRTASAVHHRRCLFFTILLMMGMMMPETCWDINKYIIFCI